MFCVTMFKINFKEIFPTSSSVAVFILYMSLFVSQGLLITNSQESSNTYNYNTTVAVFLAEFLKLTICAFAYCSRNSLRLFFEQMFSHRKLLWLYFIPAFLYCLYNNLSYTNLLNYDPTTYYILLQFRVVITGLLYQILFNKTLTAIQWMSLILLTIGCILKNVSFDRISIFSQDLSTPVLITSDVRNVTLFKSGGIHYNFGSSLIFVQMLCSCFAGVYCEYLLKSRVQVDIIIQNLFLYFNSLICNIMILCWHWDLGLFDKNSWLAVSHPKVLLVILNNAVAGVVTSFFLKYLNSILKTVASALELVFITLLSWLIFNIPIKFNTTISIGFILFSIFLYSRNPVSNYSGYVSVKKADTNNP